MSSKINFEVPTFLPQYIKDNLTPLMIFSNEDDTKRWGVFYHKEKFNYDEKDSKFFELTVVNNQLVESPLTNNFDKDSPLFLIPIDDSAKSEFCNNLIRNRKEIFFNFQKITYKSEKEHFFQIVHSQTEKLANSKPFVVKENGKLERNNYLQLIYLDNKEIPYFNFQLQTSNIKDVKSSKLSLEKQAVLKLDESKIISPWTDQGQNNIKKSIESTKELSKLFSNDKFNNNENGIFKLKTNELKIYYYKSLLEKSVEILQLNNEIFTKYTSHQGSNNDLLTLSIAQIESLRKAVKVTKKSQPFALLPKFSIGEGYTIYNQYKLDNHVVTLISSKVVDGVNSMLTFDDKSKLNNITKNLTLETDIPDFPEVNDNGTFARFLIGKYNIEKLKSLIDGVFQFDIKGEASYKDVYDHNGKISFVLQRKSTQAPLFLWQLKADDLVADEKTRDWEIGYSIEDFSLPVQSVKPISQDINSNEKYLAAASVGAIVNGYGERQEKQLVVPLNNAGATNEYYLCISESVNLGQDFRVDMRLIEVNPKADKELTHRIQAVVLDSSPQFVGLVDSNFLVQRGYDDGVWVLAQKIQSNRNQGVWEIFDDKSNQDGFKLVLPAQTIGEEFIKDDSIGNSDILNYKFGAPATLKISGDKLEKNYVSPPWDLRRFWGKAGDIQPGLPLLQAQFELLYGLQANLKPRNTSIAELGARLGDLPVPFNNNLAWKATLEQVESFYKNWISYLNYYRAWKSRLAILETYRNNNPNTEASFVAPSLISEELDYKPRLEVELLIEKQKIRNIIIALELEIRTYLPETSKYVNTIYSIKKRIEKLEIEIAEIEKDRRKKAGAQLAIPNSEFIDPIDIESTQIDINDLHPVVGLKGGFTYGFQDKEIYKLFLQKALTEGSTSAELSGLAFSSQGGYGKQVARFDNDLTAIKSLTAMGRVHRYAVERNGRIGVFWHKAKHVIEYERTVVSSPYGKDNQNEFTGRPIVRKLREYIEILEPHKKYPDFEHHSPKDTGAVNACVFKSTIIPISNSWGRIVYEGGDPNKPLVGWEVPLWYEGADVTLFPKPQVMFLLEPPKDANIEHTTAQLAEPENLVFYTAYNEETAEVLLWKSVYGVDFTDKPVFDESVLQPCVASGDKNRLDQPMPNAIDVLPGHGRFTFKVEPQQTPAGMANVYQPDSGLSGVLKTVSMQRNGEVKVENNQFLNPLINILNNKYLEESNIKSIKELINSINVVSDVNNKIHFDLPAESLIVGLSIWGKIINYSNEYISIVETKINDFSVRCYDYIIARKFPAQVENLIYNLNYYVLDFPEYRSIMNLVFRLTENDKRNLNVFAKLMKDLLASSTDEKITKVFLELSDAFSKLEIFTKKFTEFSTVNPRAVVESVEVISSILKQLEVNQNTATLATIKGNLNLKLKEYQNRLNEFLESLEAFKFEDLFTHEIDFKSLLSEFTISDNLLTEIEVSLKDIDKIATAKTKIANELAPKISTIKDSLTTRVKSKIVDVISIFTHYVNLAKEHDEFKIIKDSVDFSDRINKEVATLTKAIDDKEVLLVAKLTNELANILGADISELSSKLDKIDVITGSGKKLATEADNVLTNYRSVWEDITAPGMGLNRKTIALVVNKINDPKKLEQQLSITPCIAKYKQFENDLNAFGVRLPVTHIFNELKAPTEQWLTDTGQEVKKYFDQFNFNEMLPNLGAMDFSDMFGNLKLPDDFTKHVKFSQGFDKENLSAWAKANFDYKINAQDSEKEPLFSISVASVWLSNAHLKAEISGNVNADGVLSKKEYGELLGDFTIKIGNNVLMVFEQTRSIFENGKFNFDLDPKRMKMQGVLKMITDATENLTQFNSEAKDENSSNENGKNDKPFKVKILKATIQELIESNKDTDTSVTGEDNTTEVTTAKTHTEKAKEELEKLEEEAKHIEIPYGMKATLDIPAISVGGGTTSMTNLSFGAQFVLKFFNPEEKRLEFVTGLGFYIGKREAPFNFTAFIFGGGGFVDTIIYYSGKNGTEIDFTMSIHASAGLFFNVGWASGSVFIYLGLEGQYNYSRSIGNSMTFTLFVMLVGTLNIMGLVSAYLIVRLALSYDGHRMIGTGYISIEIEICWCLTISVSSSFQKQFTGSNQSNNTQQQSSISASLG